MVIKFKNFNKLIFNDKIYQGGQIMGNNGLIPLDFSSLPINAESIFKEFAQEKIYEKGSVIYRQEENASAFYFLKKGKVKVFFNSADGMEKTASLAESGSVLGEAAFFDQMPRVSTATTVTRCVIIPIDRPTLLKIFGKYPNLAMYLLTLQAKSIRMLSSQVTSMTFQKADKRISNALLQSKTEKNVVNLTHEEIGNLVGVSRVTVSKILNGFAELGLIKTAYKSVVILNAEKLKKIAHE